MLQAPPEITRAAKAILADRLADREMGTEAKSALDQLEVLDRERARYMALGVEVALRDVRQGIVPGYRYVEPVKPGQVAPAFAVRGRKVRLRAWITELAFTVLGLALFFTIIGFFCLGGIGGGR